MLVSGSAAGSVSQATVPVDGGSRMPRRLGRVAYALAFRQPDRHLRLGRRQFQGRGHQGGIDARVAPRLDNQHQRGHVPRAVVRVRDAAHRLDVHHERRHRGRAAEPHRPADRDGAGGRQRVAHQPVETDLVGRRAGAQPPVPVPHPIAASQEATGAVVDLQDLPAPIRGLSSRAVTVVARASAATSACRTRTNCRRWGSSPVTIAICDDPQPAEVTGSPRLQVMWEPCGLSRRTFKPFW